MVSATSERVYKSELRRLKGEFLLRLSARQNEARAEAEYLRALDIAQNQGARSLELRTATSLHGHCRGAERERRLDLFGTGAKPPELLSRQRETPRRL